MPSLFSILLLTVFTSQTLTLPTPQSTEFNNPPIPGSLIQCTPSPLTALYITPPTSPHCAIALRALPSIQAIGAFHHSDPADDFRLPISTTYGTCHASVELGGGRSGETSSWLQIGLAATQLNMACVERKGGKGMGGSTTAGAGNGIVVTVRESGGMVVPWRNESFADL